MKNLIPLVFTIFFSSCNQSDSDKNNIDDNAIKLKPDSSKTIIDTIHKKKNDSILLFQMATKILNTVKNRDYKRLAPFIHPQHGIRFSAHANIDTIKDRKFSVDELITLAKQNRKISWNSGWTDDAELLNVNQYFSKYIYDVDFLNAELKSLNKFHSQGTELNNIKEIYPGCNVVELFFSGFEKKYEGIDFRALRLVFKMQDKIFYLIAIVHDQWTP